MIRRRGNSIPKSLKNFGRITRQMTREEFIQTLEDHNYSYDIEGDKIIVTHTESHVNLNHLTHIPPNIIFNNVMDVDLESIKDVPRGVEFRNKGSVYLASVITISPDSVFNNGWAIDLGPLEKIPSTVVFNNKGWVNLDWFGSSWEWSGNIKGIGGNRLLNKMISIGLFER